jgi:RNA polymerase sigma-70 factor (ECF subfamily)
MTADLAQPLMAAAMRLARRRADAEDLVQDTLHRAWRAVRTFRRGSRFPAWMFRILHNAFLNRVRHESMAPEAADPTTLEAAAPEAAVPDLRSLGELPALADRHFDDRVKRAVEDLSETYRVPFLLFALGGLSYEEISATLGIPMGTVMSRLHRARSQLRQRLVEYARESRVAGGES